MKEYTEYWLWYNSTVTKNKSKNLNKDYQINSYEPAALTTQHESIFLYTGIVSQIPAVFIVLYIVYSPFYISCQTHQFQNDPFELIGTSDEPLHISSLYVICIVLFSILTWINILIYINKEGNESYMFSKYIVYLILKNYCQYQSTVYIFSSSNISSVLEPKHKIGKLTSRLNNLYFHNIISFSFSYKDTIENRTF